MGILKMGQGRRSHPYYSHRENSEKENPNDLTNSKEPFFHLLIKFWGNFVSETSVKRMFPD